VSTARRDGLGDSCAPSVGIGLFCKIEASLKLSYLINESIVPFPTIIE
jgi:hypothetical protein